MLERKSYDSIFYNKIHCLFSRILENCLFSKRILHQFQEKLQPLFRKKCLSNEALGRWYDVCDGPFPARLLSVEVNLLNPSTEAFVELLASA